MLIFERTWKYFVSIAYCGDGKASYEGGDVEVVIVFLGGGASCAILVKIERLHAKRGT